MPCDDCGASVARGHVERHVCDPDRRLDYVLFQLRDECAQFDEQLTAYLESPLGRFQAWYAARQR